MMVKVCPLLTMQTMLQPPIGTPASSYGDYEDQGPLVLSDGDSGRPHKILKPLWGGEGEAIARTLDTQMTPQRTLPDS